MHSVPWRTIVTPHEDILEGNFQEAEFAADLSKVSAGIATPEYQDPKQFFERTFITEGMRLLLRSVIRRLSGQGGDPVIQLKTAFGGGKTHAMLAVYHLARGLTSTKDLCGIPNILDEAAVNELPKANVAVLDGHALGPAAPRKRDGITINTMWGELAWMLGGAEGYGMIAESDLSGSSPGKIALAQLFERYAPCVILMDETVAYLRQFEENKSYPGGTFDSNMSFMQALTEAANTTAPVTILASLPESLIELGGARGKFALESIEKIFGRLEAIWKPVATEESFEIVRRRLLSGVKNEQARDEVCSQFFALYANNASDFPPETREHSYFERLKDAYPIHPEVFDRLYNDWSSLERFQRTRGVLRLMALVIHRLWTDNNQDSLITPGSIPLYDPQISNELIRYLPAGWEPIVEREVDAPKAMPPSSMTRIHGSALSRLAGGSQGRSSLVALQVSQARQSGVSASRTSGLGAHRRDNPPAFTTTPSTGCPTSCTICIPARAGIGTTRDRTSAVRWRNAHSVSINIKYSLS